MNEVIKIKPCPFCGGEARLEVHRFWCERTGKFEEGGYSVQCSENECIAHAGFFTIKEEAIEKWNTRTPTVEAKPDWIPTSERLPEQSDEYIVQIYGDIEPTTLTFYPDPADWMDEDGHYYKVIAWQPLPQPYRKKVE